MEDEYEVVCALSISATFDDLEWPRTPVSRSQCSLEAYISQTVHPIHSEEKVGLNQYIIASFAKLPGLDQRIEGFLKW